MQVATCFPPHSTCDSFACDQDGTIDGKWSAVLIPVWIIISCLFIVCFFGSWALLLAVIQMSTAMDSATSRLVLRMFLLVRARAC